jgi:two-component system, OmpR family, sensor kinase
MVRRWNVPGRRRGGALTSARTRLMVSYVVLLVSFGAFSTVALREVLLDGLRDRVREAQLEQEVSELRELVARGRDPRTGRPFGSDLRAVFDLFFERNVPSRGEAHATFVDGRPHKEDLSRYPLDRLPPEQVAVWANRSQSAPPGATSVPGAFPTEYGDAYYELVRVGAGSASGAFAIVVLPAAERAEIAELQQRALGVIALAVALGTIVLAFAARRVLEPVKLLADTARSISQTDLTRRIQVRRDDEAGEMVSSFNSMLDRLEAVFESHREFLKDVGHELRVPLTIAIGQLELLSEDPVERRRTVELVIDELVRAARFVEDLRVLAEADDPRFVRPAPLELAALLDELMAKARALAPRSWVLQATDERVLVADRDRLTQAVMNLAQNAVQHTQHDDEIAIGASVDARELRIWVRDSGPGVPADERQRIFERFERGRDARQRYRGAGLGLSIVRLIAEAHGGRVEIESELGEGTCVTIVVPDLRGAGRTPVLVEEPA